MVGAAVGPLVRSATDADRPRPPTGIDPDLWLDVIGRGAAGSVLGQLERLLAFAAFWQGGQSSIIIAGWLAFKVASGWNNWSYIVRLPEKLEGVKDLDYLRARSQLGSWIFHRFLRRRCADIVLKDDSPTPCSYGVITEVGDDYFVVEHIERCERHVSTYSITALISITNLDLTPVR